MLAKLITRILNGEFRRSSPSIPKLKIVITNENGKVEKAIKAYVISYIDEHGVPHHYYEGETKPLYFLVRNHLPTIISCVRRTICDTLVDDNSSRGL